MKYLYFIKWSAKKLWSEAKSWDRWMWGWFITCFWGPNAVIHKDTNQDNFYAFMMFVLIFWVGYGLIYTGIKRAFRKFQEEQERMVEHLKDMG